MNETGRWALLVLPIVLLGASPERSTLARGEAHVWELQEITFESARPHENPYAEVVCWIDLEGPGFTRRVYGFWDGGRTFKVRFVATAPGEWRWRSGSNDATDAGLNGGRGLLRAVAWTDAEKLENPNRRGFVRATPNGHGLAYADGSPFFLLGDTWLAASTWRLPWRGTPPAGDVVPGPGLSFEEAVAYRRRQGFNSISVISAFPNWDADHHGATFANADGVYLRNAWEKFGSLGTGRRRDDRGRRHDHRQGHGRRVRQPAVRGSGRARRPRGFRPAEPRVLPEPGPQDAAPVGAGLRPAARDGSPRQLPIVEGVLRLRPLVLPATCSTSSLATAPSTCVFSGIHLDWIPKEYSLTAEEFGAALTYHWKTYGPPPFGQPFTTLIDSSTYRRFGHADAAPWLSMHTVGNKPRNNAIYASIEELFRLRPPYPAANLEPYYAGWNHEINRPGGEAPAADSERDRYFARSMMYGSVLSGALAGHVYGTGAYDVTSTGEPPGWRPYIWDALRYASGTYMQHLGRFVLSEGHRYQQLEPSSSDLEPRAAPGASDDGLDGWSFMMRTTDRRLALLYFEEKAVRPRVAGLAPRARYDWRWYDPREGRWLASVPLRSGPDGSLRAPLFPGGASRAERDWAAKLTSP